MTEAVATSPEGSSKAPRVSFWTLGCRLNQYDTAALRARFLGAGMVEAGASAGAGAAAGAEGPDAAAPNLIVVNTCTVARRQHLETPVMKSFRRVS